MLRGANLSSPSNINPCRISLSIKWAVDGSLPARRDGKFDVRGTRSSDFRKKINTNEEDYWEEGNGFLEDSVFFVGKISIVLKDFTPAGYPSFHFAR